MKWINSQENPQIKEIIKIKKKPEKKVFVEGINLLRTVLESDLNHRVDKIFITESFISKHKEFFQFLSDSNSELIGISDKLASKISDTVSPQGIFALITYGIENSLEKINDADTIVILDRIQDPGNLGTIIRSSEALGAQAIILSEGCCNPLASKVIRASAGSVFLLPVIKTEEDRIKNFLEKSGFTVILTEPKADKNIFEIELKEHVAVVLGNEAQGISKSFKEIPHIACKIPQTGKGESLNVAVSASIILYEILRAKLSNFKGRNSHGRKK